MVLEAQLSVPDRKRVAAIINTHRERVNMQSGQEMLEETITICERMAEDLASEAGSPAWEKSVTEIASKFGEVSGTFFFKTMPSVPATRACLRDATTLLELSNQSDWAAFGPASETLIASAQTLIEKAGMKGTVLT